MIVLAIDPGDHMGWSLGSTTDGPHEAGTDTPSAFFARLERLVGTNNQPVETEHGTLYQIGQPSVDVVIFEGFAIDGPQLIGSDVPTLQYIGVIKYICARAGVRWEVQDRQIKGAARSKCKATGIRPIPGDVHSKDAQLHWWAWCWRHPEC